MNVSGLANQQRIGAELLCDERVRHLRRRHRQGEPVPLRNLVGHHEADVVSRLAIFLPGFPRPTINRTRSTSSVLSSSFSSVLPFLMTSGSAAVPAAATGPPRLPLPPSPQPPRPSARRRARASSRRRSSPSTSDRWPDRFTRTDWCSISSLTSTSMCSGMSVGRHCTWISRVTKSSRPPCCLTPAGSPLMTIGTDDDDGLVHRELVEVGVQQLVRDRVELVVPDHHARFCAAIELEVDQRVGAGLGVKDAEHLLRIDRDGHAFGRLSILARAVDHGGDPARPRGGAAPRSCLCRRASSRRVSRPSSCPSVYGLRSTAAGMP